MNIKIGCCWVFVACALVMPSAFAYSLSMHGELVQGGLLRCNTQPGSVVKLAGLPVHVSPAGDFLLGFDRDEPHRLDLEIILPDGRHEQHHLTVKARQYNIQRIDGLPAGKVDPSKRDYKRIGEESALLKLARQHDDPRTDFSSPFIWPVTGRISGVYGSQRILNGKPKRPHYGVDIAVPTGTPIVAPAAGVVTLAHNDMFFSGGTLILDHGHGLSSSFLHLSKITITQGAIVKQGDKIAEVGATGRVTGPHLHWAMNLFKRRLDPQLLVKPISVAPAL